ncbi:hypothetical protein CEXT_48461 [Caerostris extrusa]|uniref:Uncharacterized protein n=1 Tax=Caerostris extrusa TaxID=172846 RepID=A0AAV4N2N9_CAEEX|nr:hypothetical protein CEXT_48461 [Caerostris extrusa]
MECDRTCWSRSPHGHLDKDSREFHCTDIIVRRVAWEQWWLICLVLSGTGFFGERSCEVRVMARVTETLIISLVCENPAPERTRIPELTATHSDKVIPSAAKLFLLPDDLKEGKVVAENSARKVATRQQHNLLTKTPPDAA